MMETADSSKKHTTQVASVRVWVMTVFCTAVWRNQLPLILQLTETVALVGVEVERTGCTLDREAETNIIIIIIVIIIIFSVYNH